MVTVQRRQNNTSEPPVVLKDKRRLAVESKGTNDEVLATPRFVFRGRLLEGSRMPHMGLLPLFHILLPA